MANNKLTRLQQEFLEAFFRSEDRFFLTGGAALAGFYLGHRQTHDLDLFTLTDALDSGSALVAEIARDFGATVESIQTAPDFRRRLMRRGEEAVMIDLVQDHTLQLVLEKPMVNGIRG